MSCLQDVIVLNINLTVCRVLILYFEKLTFNGDYELHGSARVTKMDP